LLDAKIGGHAEIPAAAQIGTGIQREVGVEHPARAVRVREIGRDHVAERQAQIELILRHPVAIERDVDERTDLERRVEIGHPLSRPVLRAVHRRRAVEAEVELHAVGLEEDAAHALAIDAHLLAPVDDERQRPEVAAALVRTAIVGQREGGRAEAELPLREKLRPRGQSQAARQQQRRRYCCERPCPQDPLAVASVACGGASAGAGMSASTGSAACALRTM
jgi:hypothetical protein